MYASMTLLRAQRFRCPAKPLSSCGECDLAPQIIKESMRMFPVGGSGIGRYADRDVDLGGYLIPKGTEVAVCLHTMQMVPWNFPEPTRFDLGRWLDDAGAGAGHAPFPLPSLSSVCMSGMAPWAPSSRVDLGCRVADTVRGVILGSQASRDRVPAGPGGQAVCPGMLVKLLCHADATQSAEAASPHPESAAEGVCSAPARSPSSSDGALLLHASLVSDSTRAADGPLSCEAGPQKFRLQVCCPVEPLRSLSAQKPSSLLPPLRGADRHSVMHAMTFNVCCLGSSGQDEPGRQIPGAEVAAEVLNGQQSAQPKRRQDIKNQRGDSLTSHTYPSAQDPVIA